jgi:hypothetical protein
MSVRVVEELSNKIQGNELVVVIEGPTLESVLEPESVKVACDYAATKLGKCAYNARFTTYPVDHHGNTVEDYKLYVALSELGEGIKAYRNEITHVRV